MVSESGGSKAWDRVLGIVMGVFAGVLLAAFAAYGSRTWYMSYRADEAAKQAELGVAADLRALAEALQASATRGAVSDAEVDRLAEDLGVGTFLRAQRPPGALIVTLQLPAGRASSPASSPGTRCVDLTVPLGATGAAGQGLKAPTRECAEQELRAGLDQPMNVLSSGASR
jgi:hypothetical protein